MTITQEEVSKVIDSLSKYTATDGLIHFANYFKQQGIEEGRKMQRESDVKVCEAMRVEFGTWKDHKYDMKALGAEECAEAIRNNTGELT